MASLGQVGTLTKGQRFTLFFRLCRRELPGWEMPTPPISSEQPVADTHTGNGETGPTHREMDSANDSNALGERPQTQEDNTAWLTL